MLSTSKIEDVSQIFFFDVVKFENSQNCFVLMLSTLKNEDVSQTCFVFDVVKFKH